MSKKIVSFGEIMLRLTPVSKQLIGETKQFDACYGGSESNVLVCLSCFGDETDYLTALPQNDLGEAAIRHLRSYGVGTDNIIRQGDELGLYFLEEGYGDRSTNVIYKRKNSEVSKLDEGAFDYDKIFKDCSIFHICGISFAVSESAKRLSFELIKEAKRRCIKVSFDFNYRAKLWDIEEAAAVYKQIIEYVDILFCSERDIKTFLGIGVADFYFKYSDKTLVVRERRVLSNDRHIANATIYRNVNDEIEFIGSGDIEFPVFERIGSGDALVGGVLHILNRDASDISTALDYGMACFVLKHTQKGDVFTLGEKAVKAYINDLSKDVSR